MRIGREEPIAGRLPMRDGAGGWMIEIRVGVDGARGCWPELNGAAGIADFSAFSVPVDDRSAFHLAGVRAERWID